MSEQKYYRVYVISDDHIFDNENLARKFYEEINPKNPGRVVLSSFYKENLDTNAMESVL